jgi:Cu/Ag efflux pump CusA
MLNRILQLSLRYRGVVISLACVILAYGAHVALRAKFDVFPEFAPPMVVIQTEAPGLSPEAVEQLVTRPVENALNGSPGLQAIRSQSIQGLSVITVVFSDRTDIYRARQTVGERLTEVAGQLPQTVKAPKMGPLIASTASVLSVGLTSTQRTLMELRTFADWTLRPRLLGVPGVAKVDIFGGEVRQLQVQIKPDRLRAHGLAVDDVLAAARQSTALRGAGFVDTANQRVVIRTEGQSLTAQDLGEVVLAHHDGISVRLRDVADVVDGPEPKFGDALIMGERGVILLAACQFGANTLEVTAALEKALEEMKPALATERIGFHPRLFRPANFIEASLKNINQSLWLGGLLVMVVLYLFLLDLRTAFISFTAIPLSLLAAVIVLDRLGVSLNTITLGGFAIAIGVVVDDAIIDVENILRRVREFRGRGGATLPLTPALSPRERESGMQPSEQTSAAGSPDAPEAVPPLPGGEGRGEGEQTSGKSTAPDSRLDRETLLQVVLKASLEVRSAVVYATFIVALVFLPVLTMTGVPGRLFAPLGQSFLLAILASLAVALTVTPALCLAMLTRTAPHSEPRYVTWLKARHRHGLERLSRRPKTVMALALAVCLGAAATLPFFGGEFLPEFREGHYFVHMAAVPGSSLEESLRMGRLVTAELRKNPHIRAVSQQAGRAELGEDPFGTHYSEIHVDLNPVSGEEEEQVVGEMRQALLRFPGVSFKIMPFLVERIEETISGTTAEVVVNLFGDNLDTLDQKAAEIRRVLAGIRGATEVQMESQPGVPEVVVRLRPERLRQFGFRPGEVLEAVETAYEGTDVAQTYQGNRVVEVTVVLHPASRKDPENIGALMLRNAAGTRVPLRELAEVYPATGRGAVVHEGAQRRQQVTCNVVGRDVASFVAEARRRIAAQVAFPPGIYPVFAGSAEAQAGARREILLHSAMAGAGIVLLLAIVFRRGRHVLLVLANLPFALVGGVLAVFASGGLLSIGSLVGFVTLFGLTMRNSIMMISHFEHLVQEEGLTWGLEAALRGASERLLPILMTALVTALGLLPLALGTGEAGREIEGPMAIVILGGLLTSTVLNLLVLPTLALRWGRFAKGEH